MSVYIIAEAGINHQGDYHTACELIHTAKRCGADAVKFQTYVTDDICDRDNPEYAWLKQCEFSYTQFELLRNECALIGIDFISTPDTLKDAEFLDTLGMRYMKIGSANANEEFLNQLSHLKTPFLISCGMGARARIAPGRCPDKDKDGRGLWIKDYYLHCVSAYPVPNDQANMARIDPEDCDYEGYSDHTFGSMSAIIAVARGAVFIEKHFTLRHGQKGPDHHMSATPMQFEDYIKNIREAESMLAWRGSGPLPCEQKTINQLKARRK